MTPPASPRDGRDGVEQEGIWEDPGAARSGAGPGSTSRASRELTTSLTSTHRVPGPAGLYFADVPNRVIALILDIVVLSLSGFVLAWLLGGLVSEPGAIDGAGGELDIVAFSVVLVLQLGISLAFFGGCWVALAATPGMRLLGLRIGDEAEGDTVGPRQALVRWLLLGVPSLLASLALYVPNIIGVILGALGAAWLLLLLYTIAQSPTRQGLHDRLARTIVIKRRRRAT